MMNDSANHSASLIEKELEALRQGESFTWGRISRLLDLIDRQSYWRKEARTFTAWLQDNAELLGVRRSMAWRYLSPGRFYTQKLRKDFPSLAQKPLEEVSDELSPENLELLSKIYRAAPEEIFKSMAVKVLSGEAKRAELKACWSAFRPVLEGKTARGRGVTPSAPQKIKFDERMASAIIRNRLLSSDPSWTQIEDIATCKVFADVSVSGSRRTWRFDLVAVTEGKNSGLMIHGIEVPSVLASLDQHLVSRVKSMAKFCDKMWVAVSSAIDPSYLRIFPKTIGVLVVGNDSIRTAQTPKPEKSGYDIEKLLRQLLALSI